MREKPTWHTVTHNYYSAGPWPHSKYSVSLGYSYGIDREPLKWVVTRRDINGLRRITKQFVYRDDAFDYVEKRIAKGD